MFRNELWASDVVHLPLGRVCTTARWAAVCKGVPVKRWASAAPLRICCGFDRSRDEALGCS